MGESKSRSKVSSNKKKLKKNVSNGIVHILASFNNTIIYITDMEGNAIAWKTAGSMGFKGSRKSTPHAAQMAAKHVAEVAKESFGMRTVIVVVRGPGPGRDAARILGDFFKVSQFEDRTALPHNGCRAQKERRV